MSLMKKRMMKLANDKKKSYPSRQPEVRRNEEVYDECSYSKFWRSTEISPARFPCIQCEKKPSESH